MPQNIATLQVTSEKLNSKNSKSPKNLTHRKQNRLSKTILNKFAPTLQDNTLVKLNNKTGI